jgi:hypothetical protein
MQIRRFPADREIDGETDLPNGDYAVASSRSNLEKARGEWRDSVARTRAANASPATVSTSVSVFVLLYYRGRYENMRVEWQIKLPVRQEAAPAWRLAHSGPGISIFR